MGALLPVVATPTELPRDVDCIHVNFHSTLIIEIC